MSAKRKSKIELRTVLYILFVVVIFLAIYFFVTSPKDTTKIYNPEQVLRDKSIGETMTIEGYFEYDNETQGYLRTNPGTDTTGSRLKFDHSNVKNSTEILNTLGLNSKVRVTGLLSSIPSEDDPIGTSVILIASKIEPQ